MKKPQGSFYGGSSPFGGRITRFEATGEYRAPFKGEYFLSGAVVQAYVALCDMTTEYWIAKVVPASIAKAKESLQGIISDPSLSFDATVEGLREVIAEAQRLLGIML